MGIEDNAVVNGSASSLDMELSIVAATHLGLRKSYAMINQSLDMGRSRRHGCRSSRHIIQMAFFIVTATSTVQMIMNTRFRKRNFHVVELLSLDVSATWCGFQSTLIEP